MQYFTRVLLFQRTLHHGNRVVLYGRACGKTLRICHDKSLEGRGGEGALGKQCVPLFMLIIGVVVMQRHYEATINNTNDIYYY